MDAFAWSVEAPATFVFPDAGHGLVDDVPTDARQLDQEDREGELTPESF